jgi:hypothetical protein
MDVAPSAKFFALQDFSTYSFLSVKPLRSYLQHPKHPLPPLQAARENSRRH